jgi:hypothetical protein
MPNKKASIFVYACFSFFKVDDREAFFEASQFSFWKDILF